MPLFAEPERAMSPAAEASALKPSIRVEDAGPCRKKISIEIPAARVAEKLDDAVREAMLSVSLPGFRPGKAPRKLVERRFGDAIKREAKEQLASEAYGDAIKEHSLKVVGDAEGGEDLLEAEVSASAPLAFTVEVEIAPEFDMPSMEGVELKRPLFEITDEMVQEQIDRLATNEGTLETKDESAPGDYLVGKGVMTRDSDGKVIHDIDGAVVQIPEDGEKGMALGVMVEDFGKQIGLPKKGESATIKTVGPDQHEVEEVRGEKVTITFTVEEINTVIPAPLEDLLPRLGLPDEAALRDGVRRRMEQQVQIQQQQALRQQVARKLLDEVEFDLPEKLTARQAARNLERRRLDMMYQGAGEQEVEEHMAELRASSDDVATRELKLFFILDKHATDSEIGVSEGEVNGFIHQLAMSRGLRPDAVRQELIQSNRVQGVARQIREHKALDDLVSKATIVEVSAEDFRKEFEESDADGEKKTTTKKKTTKKKSSKKSD
jgi:trigger factor